MAKKRTTRRRRPSTRSSGPLGRGTLSTAAGVGAGMLASDFLANKFAGRFGNDAIIKIGFAFLGPLLAKKFLGAKFADNMAAGAMLSAALPFARQAIPGLSPLSGIDGLGEDFGLPGGVAFPELSGQSPIGLLADQTMTADEFAGVGTIEAGQFVDTED